MFKLTQRQLEFFKHTFKEDDVYNLTSEKEVISVNVRKENKPDELFLFFSDGNVDLVIGPPNNRSFFSLITGYERRTFNKETFKIDDMYGIEGYTFGYKWNGFECPFFTRENAVKVLEETIEYDVTDAQYLGYRYEEEGDKFILELADGDELEFEAEYVRDEDNNEYVLYPIGGWMWCWEISK